MKPNNVHRLMLIVLAFVLALAGSAHAQDRGGGGDRGGSDRGGGGRRGNRGNFQNGQTFGQGNYQGNGFGGNNNNNQQSYGQRNNQYGGGQQGFNSQRQSFNGNGQNGNYQSRTMTPAATPQPVFERKTAALPIRRVTAEATTPTVLAPMTPSQGFEPYREILVKNIFDPNRLNRRAQEAAQARAAETHVAEAPAPVIEHIDLLGVWVPDNVPVAIIDGNRLDTSSQIGVGQKIKEWQVASIDTSRIVLTKGDQRLEWPIGQRIERKDEGEWHVAGAAEAATRSPAGSPAASSGGGNSAEAIKKMMERRQREMGQ